MQRLRLRFCRGARLKYISHLDLIRLWHRAFRRAGLELAYSEGFSPHPRIHIAAPLPLGVTGESELMDVVFAREYMPQSVMSSVNAQLPPGIKIEQIMQVALTAPSLQGQVRRAHYRVEIPESDASSQKVESLIASLLALETLPWTQKREEKVRSFDLRCQIGGIWIEEINPSCIIVGMDLQCDSGGSGRPEQVVKALGLPAPASVHRIKLVVEAS
jgi:radical SAM-linked protein